MIDRNAGSTVGWINLALKALFVGLLLLGVVASDWPQFQGKAMIARALTFPLAALIVPGLWWLRGPARRYPHLFDIMVVLPFVIDSGANALNLYNTTEFFDGFAHWLNWAILVTAFGVAVSALRLSRLNVFALAVGFGATTHICWEVIEYGLMQLGSSGLQLTYADTIDDLVLSLLGSICGAAVTITVLWGVPLVPERLFRDPAA
jgi:hypothetical protein